MKIRLRVRIPKLKLVPIVQENQLKNEVSPSKALKDSDIKKDFEVENDKSRLWCKR